MTSQNCHVGRGNYRQLYRKLVLTLLKLDDVLRRERYLLPNHSLP